jgi:hypothetical protein
MSRLKTIALVLMAAQTGALVYLLSDPARGVVPAKAPPERIVGSGESLAQGVRLQSVRPAAMSESGPPERDMEEYKPIFDPQAKLPPVYVVNHFGHRVPVLPPPSEVYDVRSEVVVPRTPANRLASLPPASDVYLQGGELSR